MKIQLTHDEILGYMEDKFHVRPTVDVVDDQTLSISYKISRLMPTINIDMHVDSVSKDIIALSYDCSSIVNGLLNGVIGFVGEKIPRNQVEVLPNDKLVLVHLDAFKQLETVFAVVEPTDITFSHDAIILNMALV